MAIRLRKRFSRPIFAVGHVIVYAFVRTLSATYRFRETGTEHLDAARLGTPNGAYLLACWHEAVLSMALSQVGRPFCAIASRSRMGGAVAYILKKLGFVPVLGSQSSGGKEARATMLEHLAAGMPCAITIDGSSGPRRVAKPGIIDLARLSGALILPAFTHSDRTWVFRSWDRFRLPKPFAIITAYYGEPLRVPPDSSGEEFDRLLDLLGQRINQLEQKGSTGVGVTVDYRPGHALSTR